MATIGEVKQNLINAINTKAQDSSTSAHDLNVLAIALQTVGFTQEPKPARAARGKR